MHEGETYRYCINLLFQWLETCRRPGLLTALDKKVLTRYLPNHIAQGGPTFGVSLRGSGAQPPCAAVDELLFGPRVAAGGVVVDPDLDKVTRFEATQQFEDSIQSRP